jgi:hypothetical protein
LLVVAVIASGVTVNDFAVVVEDVLKFASPLYVAVMAFTPPTGVNVQLAVPEVVTVCALAGVQVNGVVLPLSKKAIVPVVVFAPTVEGVSCAVTVAVCP